MGSLKQRIDRAAVRLAVDADAPDFPSGSFDDWPQHDVLRFIAWCTWGSDAPEYVERLTLDKMKVLADGGDL